jgi:hypothetical protein
MTFYIIWTNSGISIIHTFLKSKNFWIQNDLF